MTGASLIDPIGAVLRGKYTLVRKLGEGAMGAVYEGHDDRGGRYAIKLIQTEATAQSAGGFARFLQEARTTSALTDPNVVAVLDAGIDPRLGLPFLVMELLEGSDAQQLVARVGQVDPTVAVRIALQAARGLATAHAAKIVHRDVKPANLFLHAEGAGRIVVKVCDFGIAKSLEAHGIHLTQTGTAMGTPLFISPEQARSAKHADARSDVWSLAVSLYCLLTSVAPFEHASSMAELLVWISTESPPHIQDLAPWIHPGLAAVVHTAMISDPALRCPSMEAFAVALRPFAGGSDDIAPADLVGASPELKARAAPRCELPQSFQDWSSVNATESPRSGDELIGTRLADRYRLERLIGRGGMGAVYEAVTESGERLAIKVILAHLAGTSTDARKRFLREARAASSIESPHVVRIVDADADPATGVPFIAMELLSGVDLHDLVRRRGAIEPGVIAKILAQAAEGLAAAHSQGVVHRDIKPANLFLHTLPSGEVAVKICDFGIAKSTQPDAVGETANQLTRTGGMLGSPLYMSPEQAKNAKHVDARTDVWSLCISMYEGLTGKEPWPGCTTAGELVVAICTEEVVPLAQAAPWVDPRIAAIVERGLARDLSKRWGSMGDLRAALDPILEGSTSLQATDLVGISEEQRLSRSTSVHPLAAAETIAAVASGASQSSQDGNTSPLGRPSRSRGGLVGAAALAVAALVAVAIYGARHRSAGPIDAAAPTVATEAAAASPSSGAIAIAAPLPSVGAREDSVAAREVRIAVRPANATVTADGNALPIVDGAIVLHADPGDRVHIVATAGGARIDTEVVILKGGHAQPDAIDVQPASGPAKAAVAPIAPSSAPSAPRPQASTAAPVAPSSDAPSMPRLQSKW